MISLGVRRGCRNGKGCEKILTCFLCMGGWNSGLDFCDTIRIFFLNKGIKYVLTFICLVALFTRSRNAQWQCGRHGSNLRSPLWFWRTFLPFINCCTWVSPGESRSPPHTHLSKCWTAWGGLFCHFKWHREGKYHFLLIKTGPLWMFLNSYIFLGSATVSRNPYPCPP